MIHDFVPFAIIVYVPAKSMICSYTGPNGADAASATVQIEKLIAMISSPAISPFFLPVKNLNSTCNRLLSFMVFIYMFAKTVCRPSQSS